MIPKLDPDNGIACLSCTVYIRWFNLSLDSTFTGLLAPRGSLQLLIFLPLPSISPWLIQQTVFENHRWVGSVRSSFQCACTRSVSSRPQPFLYCNEWLPLSHRSEFSISGSWLHIGITAGVQRTDPQGLSSSINLKLWVLWSVRQSFLRLLRWLQLWEPVVWMKWPNSVSCFTLFFNR